MDNQLNLIVFDSSNLIYRNYHMMMTKEYLPKTPEVLCDLMMRSFIKETREIMPDGAISLWDFGRPSHRDELFEGYKASREASPDLLKEARGMLCEILPQIGIASVGSTDAEADDLAHLITQRMSTHKGRMISTDYDWLLSLIGDWELYRPVNGDLWTFETLKEYYDPEFPLEVCLIVKAICGDGSDEIPGLEGIKEGTGIPLARLMVRKEELGHGVRAQRVRDNMALLERNMKIMTMSWILERQDIIDDMKQQIDATVRSVSQMSVFKHKPTFKQSNLDEWREIAGKFKYDQIIQAL